MKYTPPMMIDLSAGRHRAQGQGPLACVGGSTADIEGESCVPGTGAGLDCAPGAIPLATVPTCNPGSSAGGDCVGGSSPDYNCVSGPSGSPSNNCHVGPGAL